MSIHIDTETAIRRASTPREVKIDFEPSILHDANQTAFDVIADPRGPEPFLRDLFGNYPVVFAVLPHPTLADVFTSEVLQGAGAIARALGGEVVDIRVSAWHCADSGEMRRLRAAFSRDTNYDREKLKKRQRPGVGLGLFDPPERPPVPAEIRAIAEQANGNLEALKQAQATGIATEAWYRDLFASAEVVYLVYRTEEGCGVGCILAKGLDKLETGARVEAMITASRTQALLLTHQFGDGSAMERRS